MKISTLNPWNYTRLLIPSLHRHLQGLYSWYIRLQIFQTMNSNEIKSKYGNQGPVLQTKIFFTLVWYLTCPHLQIPCILHRSFKAHCNDRIQDPIAISTPSYSYTSNGAQQMKTLPGSANQHSLTTHGRLNFTA